MHRQQAGWTNFPVLDFVAEKMPQNNHQKVCRIWQALCARRDMDSDIYDKVKDLACSLVNASGDGDTKKYWGIYQELMTLCSDNEIGEKNHPFQWETLADFTTDDAASIGLYEKAFSLAEKSHLDQYMSSIKFAIAERYLELGLESIAYDSARQANMYALKTNDLELRKEISEFLLNEKYST